MDLIRIEQNVCLVFGHIFKKVDMQTDRGEMSFFHFTDQYNFIAYFIWMIMGKKFIL